MQTAFSDGAGSWPSRQRKTEEGRVEDPSGNGRKDNTSEEAAIKRSSQNAEGAREKAIFERVRSRLKTQLGPETFASWFGRLKLHSMSKSTVRLSVPTTFLRAWIQNRYLDVLTALFQEEDAAILKVEILVRSATRPAAKPAGQPGARSLATDNGNTPTSRAESIGRLAARTGVAASQMPSSAGAPATGHRSGQSARKSASANQADASSKNTVMCSPLDPKYSFETFVEGASNRVALAAARTIAETRSGAIRFNPLFIHSSVGQGKTHLLQAIAATAAASDGDTRVVYLTAEYFMWRFATAIRDNEALFFKESLRNIDLLVIDDMQFLQGKSIQNEFCHLLNMLLDSARQVVVAADRAPSELESLDQRVRSRLQGGVAIEMDPPDFEMRLEILKRRLEAARMVDASLDIPEPLLAHVAKCIASSGRELDGAFNQLLFRRSFEPDLTIERIDELLGHLVQAGEQRRVRIEDIQRTVSKHYNVSRQELVSNRRTRMIVKPRQIAMYLAKTMTPKSFPEIGRRFGGRDHTTVLHAVRKIEALMAGDTKLAQEIELLRRLINE